MTKEKVEKRKAPLKEKDSATSGTTPKSKRPAPEIDCHVEYDTCPDIDQIWNLKCHEDESGIGFENTIKRITRDDSCQVGAYKIVLYSAFRDALMKQICLLKNNTHLVAVLYHGAPNVGKSSLSLATAYYLALAYGSSTVIKFQHRAESRHEVYEGRMKAISDRKCIVIDQLNTNTLQVQFITQLRVRRSTNPDCLPFTMFTSGHYPPPPKWVNPLPQSFHYRVIDLAMQREDVENLILCMDTEKLLTNFVDSIWNVTKSYGLLMAKIEELMAAAANAKAKSSILEETDIVNIVYDATEMESSQLPLAEQLWVFWPDFFRINKDKKGLSIEGKDFPLEPQTVQYLSLKLSQVKLNQNDPLLAVLSWFILVPRNDEGSAVACDKPSGYTEMEEGQYQYVFANSIALKNLLLHAMHGYNHDRAMQILKDSYELMKGKTNMHFCAGGLFEEYIRLFALVHHRGVLYNNTQTTMESVDRIEEASTVSEILNHISCQKECNERHKVDIWVQLNKSWTKPFKGYEFAHLKVFHEMGEEERYIVTRIQLFQATVSPGSKKPPPSTMKEVLDEMARQLEARGFCKKSETLNIVEPFILVPADVVKMWPHVVVGDWKAKLVSVNDKSFQI